jgi:hypothetical protein
VTHTYASLPAFKDFIRDGGSGGTATTNDTRLLAVLESSSRAVERYTARSRFGSGFGPRTATNRYDVAGWASALDLGDDLLSITTATLLDSTAGSSLGTAVVDTDYYLRGTGSSYDPPYREFLLHGEGSITSFGVGYRTTSIAGSWGYQDVRVGAGTAGTASASATAITITGGAIYAGQTFLWESEQLYVTASTGGTALTVKRGQNGTTAALHPTAAVEVYQYPVEVEDATLQVALRRWKARDAGADGSFQGGGLPSQTPTFSASEASILMRTVGHLKVYHVG